MCFPNNGTKRKKTRWLPIIKMGNLNMSNFFSNNNKRLGHYYYTSTKGIILLCSLFWQDFKPQFGWWFREWNLYVPADNVKKIYFNKTHTHSFIQSIQKMVVIHGFYGQSINSWWLCIIIIIIMMIIIDKCNQWMNYGGVAEKNRPFFYMTNLKHTKT